MNQETIRNFCIIAHIDHGKSTLADRFLELTQTIERRKMREQFLDQMDLEREKGITIKMQPVRMLWRPDSPERSEGPEYILNLIDTPGHADFSYEVSRSLAAVEGAVLLVDATKGIQAQTLAHLREAQKLDLVLIPAVNKIDSPLARTEEVVVEVSKLLQCEPKEVFRISAKEGTNVKELLDSVVARVPCPKGGYEKRFRALIFDSHFDAFKGVIAFVRVVDGSIKGTDKIFFLGTKAEAFCKEVGYFLPQEASAPVLCAGEIGYVATGVKEPSQVRIGDTISASQGAEPIPGFEVPNPVVFVSLYPQDSDDFDILKDALLKLHLQDPSFTFDLEAKEALGRGFRCGFLGVLHSEIITERVKREFRIEMVISRPSVEFILETQDGKTQSVKTPAEWPEQHLVKAMKEPWAELQIITPPAFLSNTIQLLQGFEAEQKEVQDIGDNKLLLRYFMPLREIVGGLYENLKNATQGMASMDYQFKEFREASLVKLEFLVAGVAEEALSVIVPRDKAYLEGKLIVEKLKELLPKQLFEVALQAAIGGKIIARETIAARRRDVTAPLYGGDVTRKNKLLERQKKGKKEMKEKGKVIIPSRVFLDIFRT